MTQYAFFKGEIVPIDQAKVSVRTQALHYGTSCFGAIRGYWNEEKQQLYTFRILDHYERFVDSTKLLRMELPYSAQDLADISLELLRREGWREDVYIRPLAYKAGEEIGCRLHNVADEVAIFSLAYGLYMAADKGAHVTFSSWQRVGDNVIPPRGKIGGAYANSALLKTDAVLSGFDEALVLNANGHLAEGSAENVFVVRRGVTATPLITDNILEGITRRTVLHLLRNELGVEVVERSIDRTEVYLADEVFFCGTGVQIAAITRVDHRAIGTGEMGPITIKVRDLYMDVVHGNVEKYMHWCTPVYARSNLGRQKGCSRSRDCSRRPSSDR
jgi:branched-chain amino acid aminotransferase